MAVYSWASSAQAARGRPRAPTVHATVGRRWFSAVCLGGASSLDGELVTVDDATAAKKGGSDAKKGVY